MPTSLKDYIVYDCGCWQVILFDFDNFFMRFDKVQALTINEQI